MTWELEWKDKERALEGFAAVSGRRPPVLDKKVALFDDLHVAFNAWLQLSRQRTRVVTAAGAFAMPITISEVESWARVHRCEWRAAEIWDAVRTLDATLAEHLERQHAKPQNVEAPDAGS